MIIGQAMDARQRLHLPEDPVEIPWKDSVDEYLATVGEQLDVGLAPLRHDRFNECKSWLKPMEYAARGVFAVRSNTPDYERFGLGIRAKRPRDWADHIAKAVDDPDRRREVAVRNREAVLAGHLTEHTAPVWAEAWHRALDNRVRNQRIGA